MTDWADNIRQNHDLARENETLRAENERLRTQCGGNCRYWEDRWRDEKEADNERLRAERVREMNVRKDFCAEVERLREEVETWKDRYHAEHQDHEATIKAWDEERSGL